ncbi:MAG: GNAT family N-acetyltransferase [Lachnospiraceae bacterium]|nr:GNAT family N-acetyltransferase [Lachnospiraceae bacterium]
MNHTYETNHLYLKVLSHNEAHMVLDFYKRNYKEFALYEPLKAEDATNLNYHSVMLNYELQYFKKNQLLRLYLFEKTNPFQIVGTVSFRNINHSIYKCATLGYKMDKDFRRKGYMEEAISKGMEIMDKELSLRRVEAIVMPKNEPSIHLLEKLDFQREGLIRDKVLLNGCWEDHYLYSHIFQHN